MEIRLSADRPSGMASRLKPSSVVIPSVTRPPLATLAAWIEAAASSRAIAGEGVAWMYLGARETIANRHSSILNGAIEMRKRL